MGAESHFLHGFFNPQSVAVVGATDNPFKMNYRLVENFVKLGFKGKVYPVNLGSKEIMGIKAFPRLQDIREKVDLVVTAVNHIEFN